MDLISLAYFVAASALLTLAPGPDILYLIAKSLGSGAKCGIILAAGLCSGLVFHTALVAFGVAAVINSSPLLYSLLKYAGAVYLLYLAWMSVKETGQIRFESVEGGEAPGKIYLRGVMMNILNPKVILFFLAFFPQFVQAESGQVAGQVAVLGTVFGLQAFCIFSLTAVLAGAVRDRLLSVPGLMRKMGWCQAAVLFCISAALVMP